VDKSVTEIITSDNSWFLILFFGNMEKIATAAEAPHIATDAALKKPKCKFLISKREMIMPKSIVQHMRRNIEIKEEIPTSFIVARLRRKPNRLTPNFRRESEANERPFSKVIFRDKKFTDIPRSMANSIGGVA